MLNDSAQRPRPVTNPETKAIAPIEATVDPAVFAVRQRAVAHALIDAGVLIVDAVLDLTGAGGAWLVMFLGLLPLAMTMALLWKIKEVILSSVFGEH